MTTNNWREEYNYGMDILNTGKEGSFFYYDVDEGCWELSKKKIGAFIETQIAQAEKRGEERRQKEIDEEFAEVFQGIVQVHEGVKNIKNSISSL